ncbi:MAG: U32 family peptidase [Clostridia bacterium]|nr:U32 family peptidase [Clostridia bacterium]
MCEPRMELLAPAGDEAALRAAVQNGADAVYLGAGSFNARRNAGNFDGDALDAAVAYCHARGVKVHVTLNTLVRQDEFRALEAAVEAVNRSGADAVIVQDFGVARTLRRMAPGIALHASTQMAVHNRQGVAFLREAGFDRAVLARELTFGEMAACAKEGIEIETFVHGALCVACSGQCLMSSLVGGRSGNRGLCAQPCRLPWRLEGREGHLLSTRDLCAIDRLAELRNAGVASLKIEGRLKRAEYVAVTVAAYRKALDALYGGGTVDLAAERAELAQMFNRGGFTAGYGPGVKESELMYPQRPNHVGVEAGRCRRSGEVLLDAAVESADALVLRGPEGDDTPVRLAGGAGEKVRCPQAKPGDALFRLVSEAQMRRARESFAGEARQIPVEMTAVLRVGAPARLAVSDGAHAAEVSGEAVQAATGKPFDRARAEAQLRKTGGTPYTATHVSIDADGNAFCPASLLNGLRRDALAALEAKRTAVKRPSLAPEALELPRQVREKPLLMAQSGDIAELEKALALGADVAVFAPEDVRPEALARADLSGLATGGRVALAVPAVLTAEALDGLNAWALENRERISMTLLGNIGQLGLEWPGERGGDYMLNVGNNASVRQLEAWGLSAYTPSVELNAGQIGELGGRTNLVVWGRLPLMHLRHCPLRAAEGMKGRHTDCHRCDGCEEAAKLNGKSLIDRKGVAFPLRRIAEPASGGAGGCVVQVLNSAPLMPLRRLDRLPATSGWRLLLDGDAPACAVVRVYRAALDGKDFRTMDEWRAIERVNTTTGHYFRGVE